MVAGCSASGITGPTNDGDRLTSLRNGLRRGDPGLPRESLRVGPSGALGAALRREDGVGVMVPGLLFGRSNPSLGPPAARSVTCA